MAMTSLASFANEELRAHVESNLARVRERIMATGRALDSVRIVAVTKTFGLDCVAAARDLGLTTVGENYVDELVEKRGTVGDSGLTWHYLGALQTNKIAKVVKVADVLCGVSRTKEVEKIAHESPGHRIYVQVDYTERERRNGVLASEAPALVDHARSLGLLVLGLMTVPDPAPVATENAFRALVDLADELEIPERSMGMTNDVELACSLGTTEIRLGRALFGERTYA